MSASGLLPRNPQPQPTCWQNSATVAAAGAGAQLQQHAVAWGAVRARRFAARGARGEEWRWGGGRWWGVSKQIPGWLMNV